MAAPTVKTAPARTPSESIEPRFRAWVAWARAAIIAVEDAPLDQLPRDTAPPDDTLLASETAAVRTMVEARRAHRLGHYARARTLLRQTLRSQGTASSPHTRWLSSWLHLWLAHGDYASGAFSSAGRLYARAATGFQHEGDIRGASAAVRGLGNVSKYLGLYSQAADYYDRAIALARECGDAIGLAAAEHNHGNVFLALGDLRAAAAVFRRAIIAFRAAGRTDFSRHASMSLATTALRRGKFSEALRLLRQAAPPASTPHVHAGDEAERLVSIAEAESGLRKKSAALATLGQAIALAHAAGEAHTEALARRARAALLMSARHGPAEALAEARRGLRCTAAAKSPTEITGELHELAARAAGRCGAWRESARHFQYAVETQKRFDSRRNRERADSLALSRELARARHHAELARVENARLSEALAKIAARLEAENSGRPARHEADVTPESLRGLGLRPRECEVLLWLIRGKSNVEIGAILGCSGETVKSHLKRIYGQLDVTNRTAAAASALARVASPAF